MSVTGKFKLVLKDVRVKALDIEDDIYFTVTGESLEGVNNLADETVRSFIAQANPGAEDRVKLEKFIE